MNAEARPQAAEWKEPRLTQPGLLTKLTKLTSPDQCAPTMLTARLPDVATANHPKAAYGNLPLLEERDPFSVLLVTGQPASSPAPRPS